MLTVCEKTIDSLETVPIADLSPGDCFIWPGTFAGPVPAIVKQVLRTDTLEAYGLPHDPEDRKVYWAELGTGYVGWYDKATQGPVLKLAS